MQLYDTARRAIVPLEPGPVVTLYSCGITPYDSAHLGHAEVYLTFDILQRRLRDLGHETRCVRNVTDVDDDILRKARELGVHYLDLAAEEIARFDADMGALGLIPAWSEPRATSAIADILTLIGSVLDCGHAYRSRRVGLLRRDHLRGVRVGQPLLASARCWRWPPSTAATPTTRTSVTPSTSCSGSRRWPTSRHGSRVGARVGRDGTSSARPWPCGSSGTTVDVHGGGRDLVFPHHECETAQSESVTGRPFVRHWLHVGLVGLDGTKMSKSLGNLVFVRDLLADWEPAAVRLALLDHHYRGDWEWTTRTCRGRRRAWTRGGRRADRPEAPGRLRRRTAPDRRATADRSDSTGLVGPRSTTISTPRGPARPSTTRRAAGRSGRRGGRAPGRYPVGAAGAHRARCGRRHPTGPSGPDGPGTRQKREARPWQASSPSDFPMAPTKELDEGDDRPRPGRRRSDPDWPRRRWPPPSTGCEVDLSTPS